MNLFKGRNLYTKFYGFAPDLVQVYRVPSRMIPPIVVELGDLRALIYRSNKWSRGQKRTFIHFMENPPKLVSNPEGTQLYIVGGTYRITDRGIEG